MANFTDTFLQALPQGAQVAQRQLQLLLQEEQLKDVRRQEKQQADAQQAAQLSVMAGKAAEFDDIQPFLARIPEMLRGAALASPTGQTLFRQDVAERAAQKKAQKAEEGLLQSLTKAFQVAGLSPEDATVAASQEVALLQGDVSKARRDELFTSTFGSKLPVDAITKLRRDTELLELDARKQRALETLRTVAQQRELKAQLTPILASFGVGDFNSFSREMKLDAGASDLIVTQLSKADKDELSQVEAGEAIALQLARRPNVTEARAFALTFPLDPVLQEGIKADLLQGANIEAIISAWEASGHLNQLATNRISRRGVAGGLDDAEVSAKVSANIGREVEAAKEALRIAAREIAIGAINTTIAPPTQAAPSPPAGQGQPEPPPPEEPVQRSAQIKTEIQTLRTEELGVLDQLQKLGIKFAKGEGLLPSEIQLREELLKRRKDIKAELKELKDEFRGLSAPKAIKVKTIPRRR